MPAVIFDLDGTVADSMDLHNTIEQDIFKRHDVNISKEEINRRFAGVPFGDFAKILLPDADVDSIVHEKRERFVDGCKKSLKAIPGALELIFELKKAGWKVALGTSAPKWCVDVELDILHAKFDVIVTIDDVKKGKPAPDIFLETAKRLNTPPEDCVVVEDGRSGMQAAKFAGMHCIGLVKDTKDVYPTPNVVTDLRELNTFTFENLLER